MSTFQSILSVIGALVGFAVVGGTLWAVFRSSAQDKRIERLQGERDDYLSRLNFIEPRLKAAEDQNELLLQLHNPADQIDRLRAQEQENHSETVRILQEQSQTLRLIDEHLTNGGES